MASEILRFYIEDFVLAHAPTAIDYVQHYTSAKLPPHGKVAYIPYNWKIENSQQPHRAPTGCRRTQAGSVMR